MSTDRMRTQATNGAGGTLAASSLPLLVDWDGTVTETDVLHLVIAEFGDIDVFRALEAEIGRKLTLREVIACEMETVRAPEDEVVAWLLDNVRVRPGFAALVAGYDPLIVSAGFYELIDPILAREGLRARVIANHVTADPGGWRAAFPEAEPCAVCGEACKRVTAAGLGPFVFVGDGFSDRCISLAAERRFARDGLARWLEQEGVAYEPFEDFGDVIAALSGEPVGGAG
jgi:2-hydroxy-3-keto-5-methylthiopentenyl-1-phosphate phosphatase